MAWEGYASRPCKCNDFNVNRLFWQGQAGIKAHRKRQGTNHNHTCVRKPHFGKKEKARGLGAKQPIDYEALEPMRDLRDLGARNVGVDFPGRLERLRDRARKPTPIGDCTRPAYEPSLFLCTQSSPNTPRDRRE